MSKLFKFKPVMNKANGQVNFSFSKKKMPKSLKKIISSGKMPILKFRLEGVDI